MTTISGQHGKIIFIEGVWGSGKTTLIKVLKNSAGKIKFLKEPNHLSFLKNASPEKITNWYMDAHYKNIHKAVGLANNNDVVLVERSPLSSIAFMEAYLNKKPQKINKEIKRLEKELVRISNLNSNKATFLYLNKNTASALARLNSKPYLKQLASKRSLLILSQTMEKILIEFKKKGIIDLHILKHE